MLQPHDAHVVELPISIIGGYFSVYLLIIYTYYTHRRLVRRIYIPLPDADSRRALIAHLLAKQGASGADMLQPRNLDKIVRLSEGYSGSDLTAVSSSFVCSVICSVIFECFVLYLIET